MFLFPTKQTLLLLFQCANHRKKRPFVLTANKALVGTWMTISDVNNIFPIWYHSFLNRNYSLYSCNYFVLIYNGTSNRTEWNPIRPVILRVINKTGRLPIRSLACWITSMITHQIGLHSVLLPILFIITSTISETPKVMHSFFTV